MLLISLTMFLICTSPVAGKPSTSQMSPRVVETAQGKLRAVLVTRPELGLPPVEVYLGIQYASTLGAELRFMPPTSSIEKWDGVRVALKHRPVCPQRPPDLDQFTTGASPPRRLQQLRHLLPFIEKQSEDCLNLNVFVPLTGNLIAYCSVHKSVTSKITRPSRRKNKSSRGILGTSEATIEVSHWGKWCAGAQKRQYL